MPESILTPHVATDGVNLAIQDWLLEPGTHPRAGVLIVHGLGEHAGRYEEMAEHLCQWGFQVRGYDHYGHGESGGTRGALSSNWRLEEDLADVVEQTRSRLPRGLPLILVGHSMGGLVAAHALAFGRVQVEGLVLSSPALDPGLTPFQRFLLAVLPTVAPDLRVHNGLDPKWISHDPRVVQAYRADRLVHDRISARLAHYIHEAGLEVLAAAPRWTVPTLLMYAGADRIVSPRGSAGFAASAPAGLVESQAFPEMFHEIFNELGRNDVYARLKLWLDQRFPVT